MFYSRKYCDDDKFKWNATTKCSNGSIDVVSFYFTNFSKTITHSEFREAFNPLGFLLDVYLSQKKNELGNVLGFVWFRRHVNDNAKMVQALNNIYFGDYYLRANYGKEMHHVLQVQQLLWKENNVKQVNTITTHTTTTQDVNSSKSFAYYVVKGGGQNYNNENLVLRYSSQVEDV